MQIPTRVWDPLYGRIDFSRYEYKLIMLPEVQRLRNVRMCNINSLLVTGASEISRFEHTIGVLHLANEWLKKHHVSDEDGAAFRAAAVLHDMQTGPFGHSLQYVLEDNEIDGDFIHDDIDHGRRNSFHQDLSAGATFAGRTFGANELLGSVLVNVSSLIKGKGRLGPLIAGTMDLDNIDNVVRLAYHVGVATQADANLARHLAGDIDVADGILTFSMSSVEKIERWQEIRKNLYNLLLLDWAEFSAKAMFTRAVELAIKDHLLGANSWVHTDAELLSILEKKGIGEYQFVGELIKRIRLGDLFEPICLLESESVDKYKVLSAAEEKARVETALIEFGKNILGINIRVIFHLILDVGKTRRSVKVKIRDSHDGIVEIGGESKRLLIGVFVSKKGLSEKAMNMLNQKILELLAAYEVRNITPIADPMGEPIIEKLDKGQLDLL
ncbi:HD superfamily phosphohydrolase [Herbaspirillum sp. 1173]|uniref:HD domain-containing protein n=1 Tax=Herbaspirillum sp. 1173 TaxID=2817734 RepID=UPI0028638113|nr:HD domain-containing protein [Herbaspirillum sp. 1173]MDR6742041.1 HD superfamily phosphohydrolase [Herbaspirillum sp. 1173]